MKKYMQREEQILLFTKKGGNATEEGHEVKQKEADVKYCYSQMQVTNL